MVCAAHLIGFALSWLIYIQNLTFFQRRALHFHHFLLMQFALLLIDWYPPRTAFVFSVSLIFQTDSCTCIGNDFFPAFFFFFVCVSWWIFHRDIFQKTISVCTWQELCLPISSLPLLCSLCLFCSHCFFSQQYCSSMPGVFNFSGLHFSNWKILSCPFFNHKAHTDSLYSGLGEGGLAEIRKTLWIEEVLKLKLCLLGRKVAVLKIQWALKNKVGLPTAMYGENYVLTMGQVLCKEFYILHFI